MKRKLQVVKDRTCPTCHKKKWFIKGMYRECTNCKYKEVNKISDFFE